LPTFAQNYPFLIDPSIFYFILFVVAMLYAMVGHGGASGYLALMAIWGIAPNTMKPTALLLNLFVSLIAFYQFHKAHHFKWAIFWPLALSSIPMAFWGGKIHIDPFIYKKILGVLLLIPIARFLFLKDTTDDNLRSPRTWFLVVLGGIIGFLSGVIGIGGGILLSPILLLLSYCNQKQAASISALFIFVNSLAGLGGQWINGVHFTPNMYYMVGTAVAGGLVGSYWGAKRMVHHQLKYILAIVLLIAVFKLFWS
jgi:uncharacterized protein